MNVERVTPDEASFHDVMGLLLELHQEGGYARLNLDKLCRDTYNVISQGMSFLARNEYGAPIALIGLVEEPFYYSDTTYISSKWLYVQPAQRGSQALKMLLRAARDEAEIRNKLLFIQIDNPDRRPKGTRMTLVAQGAGFVPLGYTLQLR